MKTLDPDTLRLAFLERREAFVETLKEQAAKAFNDWFLRSPNAEIHAGEPAVRAEEIAVDTTMSRRLAWITYVDREAFEELGPGEEDQSPIDSILRFIVWCEHDSEVTLAAQGAAS